jgi:hypothetical protein
MLGGIVFRWQSESHGIACLYRLPQPRRNRVESDQVLVAETRSDELGSSPPSGEGENPGEGVADDGADSAGEGETKVISVVALIDKNYRDRPPASSSLTATNRA